MFVQIDLFQFYPYCFSQTLDVVSGLDLDNSGLSAMAISTSKLTWPAITLPSLTPTIGSSEDLFGISTGTRNLYFALL